MPIRPSTRTFSDLKFMVKRAFGDESGVQLEDADILRWANEATQNIAVVNRLLRKKGTAPTVLGTHDYLFPNENIAQINSLHLNGLRLSPVEFQDAEVTFLASDPLHEAVGTPLYWWFWGDTVTLWPSPDDVGTLTLYYTRNPIMLTGSDLETLDVPDKHYQTVVDYVLWRAYEMDEDWQAAQAKEGQYRGSLAEQKEDEFVTADMNYPVVREVW
jgi:hypothetical protein